MLTTPLIRALKERFPGAELEVLARKPAAPVLEGNPSVDAVIPYDKRGGDNGLGGMVRMAGRLRARGYDLCVSPHRSLRSALLAAAAGIPQRVGMADSPGRRLYHHRIEKDRSRHELERHLALIRAVGGDPDTCRRAMVVEVVDGAARSVLGLLAASGIDPDRPIIGIQHGSEWPTKQWVPGGFGAVAAVLRKRGYQVVLFGVPGDREVGDAVLNDSDPGDATAAGAANLAGKTTLQELVALIDRCEVFITNDTGPMHIAVARDVPVVAIFGPTVPSQGFGPYSEKAVVVETKDLPCRPCGRHGHRACPEKHFLCMKRITPSQVLEAFDRVSELARGDGDPTLPEDERSEP